MALSHIEALKRFDEQLPDDLTHENMPNNGDASRLLASIDRRLAIICRVLERLERNNETY